MRLRAAVPRRLGLGAPARRFLRNADAGEARGRIIVDHVIHMGKELGMSIVAEGVETEAQKGHLLAAGCDSLQGFLFSPPIPVDAFEKKSRIG